MSMAVVSKQMSFLFFEVLDAVKFTTRKWGCSLLDGIFGVKMDEETIPTFEYIIKS
jgi:hypothetical protein